MREPLAAKSIRDAPNSVAPPSTSSPLRRKSPRDAVIRVPRTRAHARNRVEQSEAGAAYFEDVLGKDGQHEDVGHPEYAVEEGHADEKGEDGVGAHEVDALSHVVEEGRALRPLDGGQPQGGDHHRHHQEPQEWREEAGRHSQPRPDNDAADRRAYDPASPATPLS